MLTDHYHSFLILHSVLRWLVLVAGLGVIVGCLLGILNKFPFRPAGRMLGLIYVSLLDTQFLVGVLLSFASPIVRSVWAAPSMGMKLHELRFFAVEHVVIMTLALTLAHIGAVRSRKSTLAIESYTTAVRWYTASLVVVLLGIPWWRPLLRF
jgi:hypothetical protein